MHTTYVPVRNAAAIEFLITRGRSPIPVSPLFVTQIQMKSSDRSRSLFTSCGKFSAPLPSASPHRWHGAAPFVIFDADLFYQSLFQYRFCPTSVVLGHSPAERSTTLSCSLHLPPAAGVIAVAASCKAILKMGVLIGLTTTLLKV